MRLNILSWNYGTKALYLQQIQEEGTKVPSFLFMEVEKLKYKVKELLEEFFKQEEFSGYFTVGQHLTSKKLMVFIDGDEAVSYTICRKISRYLESHFDEHQWLGEKYTLEVSSPGIDRPLIMARQFAKHQGRKADVSLKDGSVMNGLLKEISDTEVIISKDSQDQKVEIQNIEEMKIIVSFKS